MKNTMFLKALDFLCPYSCIRCNKTGSPVCDCCKKYIINKHKELCINCGEILDEHHCWKCASLFDKQYWIGTREGLLKEAINKYKYDSLIGLSRVFGEILSVLYGDSFDAYHIVPLPTINRHVRVRGFDHTLELARCLGEVDLVLGRKNNSVQVGSSEEARKKQASAAYEICKKIEPSAHYLLLDDVWTTGSSMLAAARLLKEAGANNISIALLAKTM